MQKASRPSNPCCLYCSFGSIDHAGVGSSSEIWVERWASLLLCVDTVRKHWKTQSIQVSNVNGAQYSIGCACINVVMWSGWIPVICIVLVLVSMRWLWSECMLVICRVGACVNVMMWLWLSSNWSASRCWVNHCLSEWMNVCVKLRNVAPETSPRGCEVELVPQWSTLNCVSHTKSVLSWTIATWLILPVVYACLKD